MRAACLDLGSISRFGISRFGKKRRAAAFGLGAKCPVILTWRDSFLASHVMAFFLFACFARVVASRCVFCASSSQVHVNSFSLAVSRSANSAAAVSVFWKSEFLALKTAMCPLGHGLGNFAISRVSAQVMGMRVFFSTAAYTSFQHHKRRTERH